MSAASVADWASIAQRRLIESPRSIPPEIDRLVDIAASSDSDAAEIASAAIFRDVVEPLADRFEPALCEAYDLIFARVLERARRRPGFEAVDQELRRLGLASEHALVDRAANRRRAPPMTVDGGRVRAAVALSRVTLGADVAVCGPILARLRRRFRSARILFAASAKSARLFDGFPRVSRLPADYPRRGGLRARLESWLRLRGELARALAGLSPAEYLVVDPDSRLAQLGLLPLAPDPSRELFFESRSFEPTSNRSIAELTGRWLDVVLPDPDPALPEISPPAAESARAREIENADGRPLAAVNFGYGGNPAKRVDGDFEPRLAEALLERGYRVILDRGAGDEEFARSERVAQWARDRGRRTAEAAAADSAKADLLPWHGSLDGFAAFIAAARVYVGYDSAGGHLAAALGTLGVDVFAGAVCPRMRDRWRPFGARPAQVVAVEPGDSPESVLRRVLERLP